MRARLLLGAAWAWLRWGLVARWVLFTLWLLIYGMPLSAMHAGAGTWALAPLARGTRARRLALWVMLASALTVPAIGLPEYAATTVVLHCRVYGFFGLKPQSFCADEDVHDGADRARRNQPLFSRREQLGLHGFNLLLAGVGWCLGFSDAARATAWLSFTADPSSDTSRRAAEVRRARCGTPTPSNLETHQLDDDFPMRSATVRRILVELLERATTQGGPVSAGAHWAHGKTNNQAYARVLLEDSLRTALALEATASTLSVSIDRDEAGEEIIRASWSGVIQYAANAAFAFDLPTVLGRRALLVSESVFCGMQADGAMNPYRLEVRWLLKRDDPRLSGQGRNQSEHGLLELVIRAFLR